MSTPKKFKRSKRPALSWSKGFTLIELLVVIAIIGVLATLILLQLGIARAKARDAKRIADVNQLRTAVELYYDDKGGSYPRYPLCPVDTTAIPCPKNDMNVPDYAGNGLEDYLSARILPRDPLSDSQYKYAQGASDSDSSGALSVGDRTDKYHIWADLERQNAPALAGDVDINSSNTTKWPTAGGYSAGDLVDGSVTTSEACSPAAAGDCIYDLGQQ